MASEKLNEEDIIVSKDLLERPLIPSEDELESSDLNSNFSEYYSKESDFSQTDNLANLDFSIPQEDNIAYADYDSNFSDQELNVKPTLGSKLKKNAAVILMIVAILIFGIYGCLSIFDVKFDHEYYLGHPNLTAEDDTSSLVVEAPVLGLDIDSVKPSVIESNESALDIPLDTDLPTTMKDELGMDRSVTDTTSKKNNVGKLDRIISPILGIGVVNKGAFYLSKLKLSQQAENSIKESKEERAEKKNQSQPNVSITSSKSQTVVLDKGTTLRSLATKYYGNPSYWVYIYEANRSKLSNPNDVSIGMKVLVPDLSEYGIENPKDPTSIQKAKRKESDLQSW